ncbi:hypothetical protein CCAX7_61950 [Capsulimonas corticalis]|uniref:Uncharacterized protein n=1 Tax=Capsulimonas corticalis TaxID=2219043 RepID=A0A402CWJ9_9BACT|nr:hypothetical protein CCAX7_61950 [Capsulimonas corticalis]
MAERRYSHRLPRSGCLSSHQDQRHAAPRNQQLALLLHLARMMLRLARRVPWSRLSGPDQSAAMEAADILKEALGAVPAPPGR